MWGLRDQNFSGICTMQALQNFRCLIILALLLFSDTASGNSNTTSADHGNATSSTGWQVVKKSAQSTYSTHRRVPKQMSQGLANGSVFSNSTLTQSVPSLNSSTVQTAPGGHVQILESGSSLRVRGNKRILKRGPPSDGQPGMDDSIFNLRRSLQTRQERLRNPSGYDSVSTSVSSSISSPSSYDIPVIAIPGNNIPPPITSYSGSVVGPPAPPESTISVTGGGGSSYYGSSSSFISGGGSGGYGGGTGGTIVATTSQPIFPPETSPPIPIGPGQGTSVPIIGGGGSGGSGGGSVLPPSPPTEEVLPPSPPPDEGDFLDGSGLGRRLNMAIGRGNSGAPGVRTRTRVLSSKKLPPATSRVASSLDTIGGTSSGERLRTGTTSVGTMRRERLRDKVKEFKTTIEEAVVPVSGRNFQSEEVFADDPNVITDFVFSDIRCFKTRQNEYFGATIHMKSGFHVPYIRDRPQDQLISDECRLEPVEGTRASYHMAVTDLRGCGVENCGESMCLTMVFPRVPILALADDEVTTIKCIPQKSTISDTKSISFAGDSMENRRSSSTVEGGVQEFVAEVGVFRQNPGSTNGLFVKRVNSGGVVQLGEPLQLRSVVRGTDGWKHAKLTDVKVWRMRDTLSTNLDNLDPNHASEVITLVDPQGCRNEEYAVIAADHPLKDPRNDMVHHFTFKAFLFRGQRVNEPLIVTAKVHACQESQDCIMACESGRRIKRSPVEIHNSSAIVHDYDSKLALRVVGLKDHPSSILDDEFPFDYSGASRVKNVSGIEYNSGSMTCNEKMLATGLGGGCIMLLICGLGLALYTYIKQGRLHTVRKPRSNFTSPYRYPLPPGRPTPVANRTPYQKPLPPTPTSSAPSPPYSSAPQPQQRPLPPSTGSDLNSNGKAMNADISQVAKLLQEIAKNNNNNNNNASNGGEPVKKCSGNKPSSKNESNAKHMKEPTSDYACIDETNSSGSSSASSFEDLRKSTKSKDGMYIVYCYNKDKKSKPIMMPMSAPSSTRVRRKNMKLKESEDLDEDDRDDDSETVASQTEESDDSYRQEASNNGNGNIAKNQVVRRTVREVKKKSKQNNNLRCSGIRRRVSSVYREGYLNGIRGAVAAAVGSKSGNSFPLKYKNKSPSTSNIPAEIASSADVYNNSSGRRINFSVRERRSARKHRQPQEVQYRLDQYSSEGMLSEATTMASDLDSAYSGSNCSKLTEDHLYELKRGSAGSMSGRCPDFRNFHKLHQNMLDVQRQLARSGAQGQQKQEVRRTASSPNNTTGNVINSNTTAVAIGLASPPLSLGETKATHFVTRDDSTTKILIVPETHV